MEGIARLGYCYNTNEFQRQTYLSSYLDGGIDRYDMYSKDKSAVNGLYSYEQIQDQNMQIKPASVPNSNRHQLSRTVPEWNPSLFPRYEMPDAESAHTYTVEQTPQSCMYQNSRGYYEHYVNHTRSQYHWIRDLSQDPTMRSRPSFTSQQTRELEEEFNNCQYISRRRRIEIAYSLNLTEKQIKTWFQNRRVKERKTRKSSDQS